MISNRNSLYVSDTTLYNNTIASHPLLVYLPRIKASLKIGECIFFKEGNVEKMCFCYGLIVKYKNGWFTIVLLEKITNSLLQQNNVVSVTGKKVLAFNELFISIHYIKILPSKILNVIFVFNLIQYFKTNIIYKHI